MAIEPLKIETITSTNINIPDVYHIRVGKILHIFYNESNAKYFAKRYAPVAALQTKG